MVDLNSVTQSSNTQVKCKLTQTAFSWEMKKDSTYVIKIVQQQQKKLAHFWNVQKKDV